jgi:4-hydroxybenzoate polyprenyltransferase
MFTKLNCSGGMMLGLPKAGYFSRMKVYLAEMYPIHRHLLVSTLSYISLVVFFGRVHQLHPPMFSFFTFIGIWSLMAVTLMVRLMDELKDKDIDRRLFSHRPLPSGKVFESDIRFSLVVVMCFYLAANVWSGPTFWSALIVLGYSMLMFKHFFMPRLLQENLLLTLATHNVLVPMVYVYLIVLSSLQNRLAFWNVNWVYTVALIAMYWAMFFAWEIVRKIRASEEENEYVTYSQILGPMGAVFIGGAAQTVTFIIGLYLYWTLSLTAFFLGILVAGYLVVLGSYVRFVLNPTPVTSKLKPSAEQYMLCVFVAQILEHGFLF